MTPTQIDLVQKTWEAVRPIQDDAAALFYGRLFELDPDVRKLFKTDLKDQGRKLMTTLNVVVQGLTRLDSILPSVQELGRRHRDYAVRPRDYETVGAALLWTLEQGLGAAFTPEVKEAWASAYGTLAKVMIDASVRDAA